MKQLDLLAFIKDAARLVGQTHQRPDDDWVTTAFAHGPAGFRIIALVIRSEADKDEAARAVATIARQTAAEQVGVVASAWMVDVAPGGDLTARPSQHPDRFEALAAYVVTKDAAMASIARITRRPTRRPVLGPWSDDAPPEGFWVETLQRAMRAGAQ